MATMDGNLSYWLATAPEWPAIESALPDRAGVVVLGAGIMGSAAAYWLARLGVPALVLERNAAPGAGATGRNAGMHVPTAADGYLDTVAIVGRSAARAIFQVTEIGRGLLEEVLTREGIDAHFRAQGLWTLVTEAEAARAQENTAALRADGFAAEWQDRATAAATWGSALGQGYAGAVYNPTGATFHSARYTRGVAAAAQRLGATFVCGAPVTNVAAEVDGWVVSTPRGTVRAQQVVVAVNAWAGDLFPELAPLLAPVRGHILVTEPLAGAQVGPFSANAGYEYGQQLPDGRLLFGGMRLTRPDREVGYAPAAGQNAPPVEPAVVGALEAALPKLVPAAAGARIERHWSGVMDFTADHQPLIGQWPGRPGLWLLVGFSGHGMPYSQVLPYAVAAQIAGQEGPFVPEAFAPGRLLR